MAFADYPIQSLMYITNRPEIIFTGGKGSWLTDHNGKRYLDFVQGWAVNCLGHSNDGMIEALNAQAKKLINLSPAFYNEPIAKLAGLLTAHSCFDKVFFANSGAEANEGAIKLARKWSKEHKNGTFQIITLDHSFHSHMLATMSALGKAGWDTIFAPQVPDFPKAILNDIASVKAFITDETVGVMLEPVQGEGGVLPVTSEFMQQLRALTKKHEILLIVDEVQTGCGRCGTLFAYQLSNVEPDIMTLGKGIGGGMPLSALLCADEVASFEAGDQGGTYNGNPLMTAVDCSVVEQLLAPDFLVGVQERDTYLHTQLLKLSDEFGLTGEHGNGLLRALLPGKDIGGQLVEAACETNPTGLLLNAPHPNTLHFMPTLNVTTEEIDTMVGMLRTLLKAHA